MENLSQVAVIPVLVGPLQVLLAILPGLLIAMGSLVLAMFKPSAVKKGLSVFWRLKLPVLAGIIVVVGGWMGLQAIWPNRIDLTPTEEARSDWNMFRGGIARRGAVLDGLTPGEASIQWTFAPKNEAFYSSPALLGNRVYVTSAEYGVFRDRGAIYCLNADTGAVVWSFEPDGYRATFSSPSISADGRYLVVGEGLHLTKEARVFCLDIAETTLSENGGPKLLWSFRTRSHVESSPAVVDGKVFVGAGDDGYYGLAVEGDGQGGPKVLWHKAGDNYPDAETSPLVYGGRVYVGLGLRGDAVCCLDAETGEELWRIKTPYPVFGPSTIVPGGDGQADRLFVGMGVGDFVNDAVAFAEKEIGKLRTEGASLEELEAARKKYQPAGEVWCIDAGSGDLIWRQPVGRVVLGAVVAVEDRLYCATRGGTVFSLRQSDGQPLGQFDVHEPVIASPAVNETHLFVISSSGRLFSLDRETLQLDWSMQFGEGGMCFSSPAIARGQVYAGSEKSGLFSMGRIAQNQRGPIWSGYLGDSRHSGVFGSGSLPDRGAKLSQYPSVEAIEQSDDAGDLITITAPVALFESMLYLPLSGGGERPRLEAVAEGEKRAFGEKAWTWSVASTITLSPAVDNESVYVLDGAEGHEDRQLYCLDREAGSLKWKRPVAAKASGAFVLTPDRLYVFDAKDTLSCLSLDGTEKWQRPVGAGPHPPVEQGAIIVLATSEPAALHALDRESGAPLWTMPLEFSTPVAPVLQGQTFLLGASDGVEARSLLDGALLWRQSAGAPSSEMVLAPSALVYVNEAGMVIALDPASGDVLQQIEGATPGLPPLVVGGQVLYLAGGELRVQALDSEEAAQRWMTTSWLGELTTPLVLKDDLVYFATRGRGIIRAGKWQ